MRQATRGSGDHLRRTQAQVHRFTGSQVHHPPAPLQADLKTELVQCSQSRVARTAGENRALACVIQREVSISTLRISVLVPPQRASDVPSRNDMMSASTSPEAPFHIFEEVR